MKHWNHKSAAPWSPPLHHRLVTYLYRRRRAVLGVLVFNFLFFVLMYMSASGADTQGTLEAEYLQKSRHRLEVGYQEDTDINSFDREGNVVQNHARMHVPMIKETDSFIKRYKNEYLNPQKSRDFDNVICEDLQRPPADLRETYQWYRLEPNSRSTFLFSAYLDTRTNPVTVKVLGTSKGSYGKVPTIYCQIWYPDQDAAEITWAQYSIVPETHDFPYAPSIYACPLSKQNIPYSVSLTSAKCSTPTHHLPIIRPRDHILDNTFTVCISPLNFRYDDIYSFVENIEINRILGAGKIVLYNHTTSSRLDKYLNYYIQEGLIDLHPWNIPLAVHENPPNPMVAPEIHYFGQVIALNDCLYRYMYRSEYLIFSDLDEVVMPRGDLHTWYDIIQNITAKKRSRTGAYLFRNTFFRIDWPDDTLHSDHTLDRKLGLRTQLKLQRETRIWDYATRTKYMVDPLKVDNVMIHFVGEFIGRGVSHMFVSKNIALLHHYRDWGDDDGDPPRVQDQRMRLYRDLLHKSVLQTHNKVGIVNLHS